ncbi:FUSC family protein [Pseudomonas sp. M30-35]|uniref:FUSC family protein n=1 Tax=Pseudomonas sp. M30-35 TaxID=1981174 RepID=UPI000B3D0BC9|nr:FUSC family protein [Pseudomonas sp. M30-35]ARU89069.1 hypothetical protein B9K09_14305 [Pseudomonas sp. M30-35]
MANEAKSPRQRLTGPPTIGPAIIAGMGCALPLLLGLFSGHPGFLWASAGAFQAAQINPLHRLGMLRMLLITFLGAVCAGWGFWAAAYPVLSFAMFAAFGFILAWLQRFGAEAGKLGAGLAVCMCLGQGETAGSHLNNPYAIGMLFILGGLWVTLLAFGLRGVHGLRMWPQAPRVVSIIKVLKRYAKRLPEQRWRLHALRCTLAFGFAGLLVSLEKLPHGYWVTMIVIGTLQLGLPNNFKRLLIPYLVSLILAAIMIVIGYSLQDPILMVAGTLSLIVFCRTFQAHHYGLYVLQLLMCFIVLVESLSLDWQLAPQRLFNSMFGVAISLGVAILIYALSRSVIKIKNKASAHL